ncbi:MAG: hypothetical protein JW797_11310 [Bradymonadales bacterium]|nr:hypothetical protein [Bradymonadales bacterium]
MRCDARNSLGAGRAFGFSLLPRLPRGKGGQRGGQPSDDRLDLIRREVGLKDGDPGIPGQDSAYERLLVWTGLQYDLDLLLGRRMFTDGEQKSSHLLALRE